ncbi:MAG: phosphate acyltransferase PlsX [Alphaproteobacteria bacterium]
MRNITIALDAMGGDRAPDIVINGAALAGKRHPEATFLIFGDRSRIDPLLDEHPKLQAVSNVVHTEEFVSGDDKPSIAIRQGRKSSMQLAINAVKEGEAQCVVSAGNTGALMAMSKLTLRMLPGIDRPAICALCPTQTGQSAMLDLGANIECNANNLLQFGVLGAAYVKSLSGIKIPTVGLLNVGEEEIKGGDVVKQAAVLFRESDLPLDFRGFVEGDDVGAGTVDVFVIDGFTGNLMLKAIEGTVQLYTEYLREAFKSSGGSKLVGLLARNAFKRLKARIDPRIYNGATFLGLNGIVVKSHGSTDDFGFSNAIGVSVDMVKNGLNDIITEELDGYVERKGQKTN